MILTEHDALTLTHCVGFVLLVQSHKTAVPVWLWLLSINNIAHSNTQTHSPRLTHMFALHGTRATTTTTQIHPYICVHNLSLSLSRSLCDDDDDTNTHDEQRRRWRRRRLFTKTRSDGTDTLAQQQQKQQQQCARLLCVVHSSTRYVKIKTQTHGPNRQTVAIELARARVRRQTADDDDAAATQQAMRCLSAYLLACPQHSARNGPHARCRAHTTSRPYLYIRLYIQINTKHICDDM